MIKIPGDCLLRPACVFLMLFAGTMLFFTDTASARYHPGIVWKTVRTEHFTLYYPEGHEAYARRVLALTDEVYRDVAGYLDAKPRRVPVVLHTETDIFNGSYAPFPSRITLFESPHYRMMGFGSSLSDLTDLVFTHEYTHYAHVTSARGLYHYTPRLLGRDFGILNIFSPGWVLEGITTNTETLFTDGGRGRSPSFDAELRSFLIADRFWGLSGAGNIAPYSPPGYGRIYLSGYYMVNYLNRTYGEDAFARMNAYQSRHPLLGTGRALKKVTRKSPKAFYREFLADFTARSDSIGAQARSEGLPAGQTIINMKLDGFQSHCWTDHGTIIAQRTGYDRLTALCEIDPASGVVLREIKTGRMFNTDPVRLLPGGRFCFGEFFVHPLGETDLTTADLVLFDPETRMHQRLTTNAGIYSADLSPDGTTFVAARRTGMWIELDLLDADGSHRRPLISQPGLYFRSPCWSPDGSHIAVAVKSGGKLDIALVDPMTGGIGTIFKPDTWGDTDPAFSPDGRWIVFVSSRSGIWNVYAWDTGARRLFQLTSVVTAASEPRVSPDGTVLSFLVISGGTNELRVMPFRPEEGKPIPVEPGTGPDKPDLARVQPDMVLNGKGIPLWEAYTPFIHIPYMIADDEGAAYGLLLMGGDPVGLNAYEANVHYGVESQRPGYSVRITNRSFWPVISAGVYDNAEEGILSQGRHGDWVRHRYGEVSAALNVIHRTVPSVIISDWRGGARFRNFSGLKGFMVDDGRNEMVSVFGEADIIHIPDMPPRAMVPPWGQSLSIQAERHLETLGGELPGHLVQLHAIKYIPSPVRHHGLEARAAYQSQKGRFYYDKRGFIPRGYYDTDAPGGFTLDSVLNLSLEYRYPLWYTDRGLGLNLIHFHLIRGSVFADYGAGWSGTFAADSWGGRARTVIGATCSAQVSIRTLIGLEFGIAGGYKTREKEYFTEGFMKILGL